MGHPDSDINCNLSVQALKFVHVSVDLLQDSVLGRAIASDATALFWGEDGITSPLIWNMKIYRMDKLGDERIETRVLCLQEDRPFRSSGFLTEIGHFIRVFVAHIELTDLKSQNKCITQIQIFLLKQVLKFLLPF